MLLYFPVFATVNAPGHLNDFTTLTAYDTFPSPLALAYYWLSPQTFTIQAVSKVGIGVSSYKALNLSSTLSSSANLAINSPASSSPIPFGAIWEHLPAFKIIGYLCPQVSRDLSSSTPTAGGSSASFSSCVSSSTSNIPFGHISVAWEILANYALNRCLSFPGNGGQLSMLWLRFPVKTCFSNLATMICSGAISGSWIQSFKRLSVTQYTCLFTPLPLSSYDGFFEVSSENGNCPWATQ